MPSGDVTTFDVDDGLVKSCVIKRARERYLVVDTHKFKAGGNYCYARLSDFGTVITDSPSPATKKALKALHVECI